MPTVNLRSIALKLEASVGGQVPMFTLRVDSLPQVILHGPSPDFTTIDKKTGLRTCVRQINVAGPTLNLVLNIPSSTVDHNVGVACRVTIDNTAQDRILDAHGGAPSDHFPYQLPPTR